MPAPQTTHTWLGGTSGAWTTASNWNPAGPPAAANAGAVFDGNHLGVAGFNSTTGAGGIPSVPALDGGAAPVIPSDALLTDYANEASQLEEDAAKCKDAEKYSAEANKMSIQIDRGSKDLGSAGCFSGGSCSKEKAEECNAIGGRMRDACNKYNYWMYQYWLHCPLVKQEPFEPADCNR